MGSATGHRRGQEADELAALSRALREGTLQPSRPAQAAEPPAASPAPAAAAAAAVPDTAASSEKKQRKKKEKKSSSAGKEEKREKKRKRRAEAEQAGDDAGDAEPAPTGGASDSGVEPALRGLQQATAALQQAAEHEAGAAGLSQQLAAVAACAAQLSASLAAAGAHEPVQALHLLQGQAELLQRLAAGTSHLPPVPPTAPQLAALRLQAEAAAAAVQQRQEGSGTLPGQQEQEQQAQRFRQRFMISFANCFEKEVEALQEAEPPLSAGVLLQSVRLAADSQALFPPAHRRLVLAAE